MIPVGDGTFYLPGYSNRQKMPTNSKLSVMIRRMFIRTKHESKLNRTRVQIV